MIKSEENQNPKTIIKSAVTEVKQQKEEEEKKKAVATSDSSNITEEENDDDRRDSGFHTMTRPPSKANQQSSTPSPASTPEHDIRVTVLPPSSNQEFATLPKAIKISQSGQQQQQRPVSESQINEAKTMADDLFNNFNRLKAREVLYKSDKFSVLLTECFVQCFDFTGMRIDEAMRKYFEKVDLVGETHERERALEYFSKRFNKCNPQLYDNDEANIHYLVCAIVLLNTDLHHLGSGLLIKQNSAGHYSTSLSSSSSASARTSTRHRMTCKEFVRNVQQQQDATSSSGDDVRTAKKFDDDHLKEVYKSIRKRPILSPQKMLQQQQQMAALNLSKVKDSQEGVRIRVDDWEIPRAATRKRLMNISRSQSTRRTGKSPLTSHTATSHEHHDVTSPQDGSMMTMRGRREGDVTTAKSNGPSRSHQQQHRGDLTASMQGVLWKKHVVEADGSRTTKRRRRWKVYMVQLDKLQLNFAKKNSPMGEHLSIHHSVAQIDDEKLHTSRPNVLRLTLANTSVVLFQTNSEGERSSWVNAINRNAALLSAAPLSAAVGSTLKFQKPLQPSSCSSLPLTTQLHQQQTRLDELLKDLKEMKNQADADDEGEKKTPQQLQYDLDKKKFLNSEVNKYRAYTRMLVSLQQQHQNSKLDEIITSSQQKQPFPTSSSSGGDDPSRHHHQHVIVASMTSSQPLDVAASTMTSPRNKHLGRIKKQNSLMFPTSSLPDLEHAHGSTKISPKSVGNSPKSIENSPQSTENSPQSIKSSPQSTENSPQSTKKTLEKAGTSPSNGSTRREAMQPEVTDGNAVRLIRSSQLTNNTNISRNTNQNNNNNNLGVVYETPQRNQQQQEAQTSPVWKQRVRGRKERTGVSRRSYLAAVSHNHTNASNI